MFHSYKGGCGKTLFSLNVANLLLNKGFRVLLIESDFEMPTFSKIFSSISPNLYFNHYLENKHNSLKNYIYPNMEADLGIVFVEQNYNPEQKIFSSNQSWFLEKIDQMKSDLTKLNYDYIIFDMAPGYHLFTINAIFLSNFIVLLMRPDYYSFKGTSEIINSIYKKSIEVQKISSHFIINQVPEYDKMNSLVKEWISQFRINFPFFTSISQVAFSGETNYYTAINKSFLPETDPTKIRIKEFCEKYLI